MKNIWGKLDSYLKANNPDLLLDLNQPATDVEILQLEQSLGVTLPLDFVECLKVHNGQKGDADWLFDGLEFLSTRRILNEWSIWKGLLDGDCFNDTKAKSTPGIKDDWWNQKWIPFTYNGAGDHLCLDLAPANQGRVGQVITLWHDDDSRKKKADSFSQWFSEFVKKTI